MQRSKKSHGKRVGLLAAVQVEKLESRDLFSLAVASVLEPAATPSASGFDAGSQVITDSKGDTFVAGVYSGQLELVKPTTVPFPKTAKLPANAGGLNCFVAEFNSAGKFLWAQPIQDFGYFGQNQIGGLALDPSQDHVYIGGQAQGPIVVGTNGPELEEGAYVAKLDTALAGTSVMGNVVWAQNFVNYTFNGASPKLADLQDYNTHGAGTAFAQSIVVTSGGVFVGGEFTGTIDLQSGVNTYKEETAHAESMFNFNVSQASSDAFVAELNPNNGYSVNFEQFAKSSNANDLVDIRAMATNKAGSSLYVTGSYQGSLEPSTGTSTIGPTGVSSGKSEVFLLDLNTSNLKVASSVTFGSGAGDVGRTVAVDQSTGNVWVGGSFSGTTSVLGTSLASKGGTDGFALQFNPGLTTLYNYQTFGGTGNDQINAITIATAGTNSGDVYLTGFFNSSFTESGIAVNSVSGGGDQIFVAELKPVAVTKATLTTYSSVKTFGDAGNRGPDVGNGIAFNSVTDQTLVTGLFNGTIDFNSSPSVALQNGDDANPHPGGLFLMSLTG